METLLNPDNLEIENVSSEEEEEIDRTGRADGSEVPTAQSSGQKVRRSFHLEQQYYGVWAERGGQYYQVMQVCSALCPESTASSLLRL